MLKQFVRLVRRLADVIDPEGAYRSSSISQIFVRGIGMVAVPEHPSLDTKYCHLWYRTEDYDKSFKLTDNGFHNDYYDLSDVPEGSREIRLT